MSTFRADSSSRRQASRRPDPRRPRRPGRPAPAEALEPRMMLVATPVTVPNFSFESGAGADGQAIGVANWTIEGTVGGNAFNPGPGAYPGSNDAGTTQGNLTAPANGRQLLFANPGTPGSQTLDTVCAEDTSYALTVAVGNRIGQTMNNFRIDLFAGDVLLASTKGDGETVAAEGGFADVTATSPVIDARDTREPVGKPLRIVLTNVGDKGGNATQVNFDNVRLTADFVDPAGDSPPTAQVTEPPTIFPGALFAEFQVLYLDDNAINVESIDPGDARVTGPNGEPLAVTIQDSEGTTDSTSVTYRIDAPGGTWDPADDGTYTINLVAGGVTDDAGNRNPPVTTTFEVSVPEPDETPPTATITAPKVVSGSAFADFEVFYADDTAVDALSIANGDVTVTGPQGQALAVSLQDVDSSSGGSTATWRVAAPGGTWDAADNGSYSIVALAEVEDTSGNVNAPATAKFAFVGDVPDTTPPSATLNAAAPPTSGSATYDFTVTYVDDEAVARATLGDGDVQVSGPNFSQNATLVSVGGSADAPQLSATYRITAPGQTWDSVDLGTYQISALAAAVTDTAGNPVAAGVVGSFQFGGGVGPVAALPAQPQPVAGAATYEFDVVYTDTTGVNAAEIDGGDVIISGPRGFSAGATLVSQGLTSGTSVTARYSVPAPGGSFGAEDDGAYVVSVVAGAVADTNGNAANAGGFGTINVQLTPAAPGGLDPTFGNGGVTRFDPPGPPLKAADVISLPDGGTITAAFTVDALGQANVTLFKTTPQGKLDTTFGGSGTGLVTLNVGADDRATSLVQLSSGKFLVAGTTSTYDAAGTETDADFFVARFNENGTVDGSFGTGGAGFGTADFGPASFDRANDQVVLPDGRILLFGQTTIADPAGDFAFARFSADGVFDTSFGNAGRVSTNLGGADVANAVAIGADGKVVAAGSTSAGTDGSFAVVRYNADGSVDTTFGTAGTGVTLVDFRSGVDEAQSIVVQPDGRLVAGGVATAGDVNDPNSFDADFAVVRLDQTGKPDASFGSGGKALTDFGDDLASINKLIFQPGGKVLASGQVVSSLSAVGVEDVRVAIARFNADGSPDATFGTGGRFVVGFQGAGANAPAPNGGGGLSTAAASLFGPIDTAADGDLTDLEAKFEQFRQESQGLVALTKGGAILLIATQGEFVEIARLVGDAGAPSLFVALVKSVSEIDVTSSEFVVRYVDDLAVDASRFGTGDIRVTGPNGFNQLAEFVSVAEAGDGPERTVRYRVKPLGTAFTNADEGDYALAVEANRVADVNGNALAAGPIPGATFNVNVPENLANLRVDGPLTGKFPAAVVGGAKATGGALRVTNSGVLDVKTSVNVTVYASDDADFDEGEDVAIADVGGVQLSLKPGKGKAVKLKFAEFPRTLPDGNYFLIARLDSTGVLPELKESDNNAPTAAAINISAPFVDLSGTPGSIKGTPAPGAKLSGSVNVRNAGNTAVKESAAVAILASLDQAVGSDTPLATAAAKLNLKPATAKAAKLSFTLPTGLAPGNYFLLAVLDSAGSIAESDETNNVVVLGQFTV